MAQLLEDKLLTTVLNTIVLLRDRSLIPVVPVLNVIASTAPLLIALARVVGTVRRLT